MKQLVECVPNYSEGRDKNVIDAIVAAIETVEGVKVLDVDPGEATNRTVVTFVGEPAPVCEAAFRGAAKAQELIDMRKHHGAHPRSGATDVLPLIPVAGITLEECATLARGLAQRLWEVSRSARTWLFAGRANMRPCRKRWHRPIKSRTSVEPGTRLPKRPAPPTWAPGVSL